MPSKERVIPIWSWNDRLEKERLIHQLSEIKSAGINSVIIDPKYGLETAYLSEDWFWHAGLVLEAAQQKGIKVWFHDELNFPSGYAGGKVLAHNKELRAKHLVRLGSEFEKRPTSWHPAHSQEYYIDVFNPEATRTFIKFTHEEYFKRFRKFFENGVILGFFTDEPGCYNNVLGVNPNSIPWTEALPKIFKKRKGYALEPRLSDLWQDIDEKSRQVRIDFRDVVAQLCQENYFQIIHDWCEKHGVFSIGHLQGEESLVETAKNIGHFFYAMQYLDWAGYDLIRRLSAESIIPARLASSAAKFQNKEEVLAETFGAFGWGLTPERAKQVINWQRTHGMTISVPHAFLYSSSGPRGYDAPPSLFIQNPHWPKLKELFQQLNRLKPKAETEPSVVVYYPMTAVWAALKPNDEQEARMIDAVFRKTSIALSNLGCFFDYLDDQAVSTILSEYETLILPNASTMPLKTLRTIRSFILQGGRIIIINQEPMYASKTEQQKTFNEVKEALSKERLKRIQVALPRGYSSFLPNLQYRLWRTLPLRFTYLMAEGKRRLEKPSQQDQIQSHFEKALERTLN